VVSQNRIAGPALVVILSSVPLFAQALVSGRVVDGSASPLADVTVELVVKGLSTTTAADGTFEFRGDATVAPFSARHSGGPTVQVQRGMLHVAAGAAAVHMRARLFDARGRVVVTVCEGALRPGATLRAPVFGKAADVAHGVYVLEVNIDGTTGRYRMLHAGRFGKLSLPAASPAALAKALAAVDTLRLSKSGCTTKNTAIESYGAALGDIALSCGGSGELRVPSLTEYLTNDDTPVPSGKTVRWASPTGSGSGASETSPGNLQTMLTASASGNVVVALGGFYDCPNGVTIPAGVTLMAKPGEAAVVDAGLEFKAFRTPNSGAWVLVDATKKIWKSAATFGSPNVRLFGFWIEFGHVHQIIPVTTAAWLEAPATAGNSPDTYAGPCALLYPDGHVYIRFQRPTPAKYSAGSKWRSDLWPGHPEAIKNGVLSYPVTEDANKYEIRMFRWNRPSRMFIFGSDVTIGPGVNAQGQAWGFNCAATNLKVKRGTFLTTYRGVAADQSRSLGNAFFDRCRFSDGSKRHLARAEWKFGGPIEGERSVFLNAYWDTPDNLGKIWFRNCTIADYHEIMTSTKAHQQFRFRNCAIFNIVDDGFQTGNMLGRVEIGYCFFLNSAIGGNNNDDDGDDPNPGQWYVHHNVFDNRSQKVSGWGTFSPGIMYLGHSNTGNQPRKNYNNTLIWGPDVEGKTSCGLAHPCHDRKVPFTMSAHEVFNNIVIRHDVLRYDPDVGGSTRDQQSDFVCKMLITSGANEKWDYNLYYRDVPPPPVGAKDVFDGFYDGIIGVSDDDGPDQNPSDPMFITTHPTYYASLDDFRASPHFQHSKAAYGPGFEAHSTDSKPALPSIDNFPTDRYKYRPSPAATVTTATSTSLSGEDWWSTPPSWGREPFPWDGLAPSSWKGAMEPDGAAITVGVLKP